MWIKNEFPKKCHTYADYSEYVLTHSTTHGFNICCFIYDDGVWTTDDTDRNNIIPNVTHWQELPEAPTD